MYKNTSTVWFRHEPSMLTPPKQEFMVMLTKAESLMLSNGLGVELNGFTLKNSSLQIVVENQVGILICLFYSM